MTAGDRFGRHAPEGRPARPGSRRRHAAQVQHRQQRIQAAGAPRPLRQERRVNRIRSSDPHAPRSRTRTRATGTGRCRSGSPAPGHGRAARGVRVRPAAEDPASRSERPRLPAHGLGEQAAAPARSTVRQGIVDVLRLTKRTMLVGCLHRRIALAERFWRLDTRLDTPPSHLRRHPTSGIAPYEVVIAKRGSAMTAGLQTYGPAEQIPERPPRNSVRQRRLCSGRSWIMWHRCRRPECWRPRCSRCRGPVGSSQNDPRSTGPTEDVGRYPDPDPPAPAIPPPAALASHQRPSPR